MEPTIVSKPAFVIVGVLYRGKNQQGEVPHMWDQKLLPRVKEIPHQVTPPLAYGVMDHYDPHTGEFDYFAGFGVERVTELPEGMVSWTVPAQTYAIFPCTLPTLMDGFSAAYGWLKESGTQRGDGPEFEFYDEHFMGGDSALYIYMPIKRA